MCSPEIQQVVHFFGMVRSVNLRGVGERLGHGITTVNKQLWRGGGKDTQGQNKSNHRAGATRGVPTRNRVKQRQPRGTSAAGFPARKTRNGQKHVTLEECKNFATGAKSFDDTVSSTGATRPTSSRFVE